jgi:hypothetical protein
MADLFNNLLVKPTLAIAARTASANGTTVDRGEDGSGFGAAMVVVHTGTITDGTHTIEVQDSPDGTTWTAVADQYLQGAEPAIGAADDDKVYEIGYVGIQRYVRATVTVAGATSGGTYGASVILGHPAKGPVTRN